MCGRETFFVTMHEHVVLGLLFPANLLYSAYLLQGNGYWEFLLQERGADIIAFDQNTIYPPEMRYMEIMVT